jgi:hypothetical protein
MAKVLWCGPAVVCTLTGQPLTRVESVLLDMGADPSALDWVYLKRALHRLGGSTMIPHEWWNPPRQGPRLSDWLDARAWRWRLAHPLVLGVEGVIDEDVVAPVGVDVEEIGHFVAVWGDHILDSLSSGRWVPLAGSRHRGRRISAVWRIEPPSGAGPVKMR